MNLKKIIIFDYLILFELLNEIKNYLNIEPICANKENLDQITKGLNNEFLIISKKKIKNFKNIIIIDQTPIKIEKIIQIINLHFIKNKYFLQSNKKIGSYNLNLNSREISKDSIKLNLTERETNLIMFLNESKIPVSINMLEKNVWNYESKLETHTVETHIYRLRKKINETFNDENFIISLKDGYKIN